MKSSVSSIKNYHNFRTCRDRIKKPFQYRSISSKEAVLLILSMDKSLVDTRKISDTFGILNVGIICPTVLGIMFGSLGYYAFGTMEENVLRSLPYDEDITWGSVSFYLVAVAFAYPLQCYPAISTIVEVVKYHDVNAPPTPGKLRILETVARPLFVTSSFIISYVVPFQAPLIAFVGNLCTTMLQLVFPASMDICLRYPDKYGEGNVRLYIDICILSLGLICFFFGVYHSIYLIRIRIMSMHSPNNNGFV